MQSLASSWLTRLYKQMQYVAVRGAPVRYVRMSAEEAEKAEKPSLTWLPRALRKKIFRHVFGENFYTTLWPTTRSMSAHIRWVFTTPLYAEDRVWLALCATIVCPSQ